MLKAVLFDFDGVIVDSEKIHKKTFMDLLKQFGVNVTKKKWYEEFAGTGSRKIFERLVRDHDLNTDVDDLVTRRQMLFLEYVKKGKVKPISGLKPLLLFLHEKGIRMAIVSGGHRDYIELLVDMLGIQHYFELIVSASDITARKPNPEVFLHAARKMNISPQDCVVFEDSYSGCKAAKAAGMKLVWLQPHKSMEAPDCDLIIEDLADSGLQKFILS
ncbi:HAD family phosphatase [Candidatus Micrarchaeota archaeon]|nr:HAD family phosphatase [Candidatus Micrarchaeota archaeon]MBU1166272.1 HAD family phosphatase [Candidatus Micrarchaeota archaeon]MBU1886735.1 HAD family phosphatase [Candidatus Micrarchaeota archaeon]